MKPYEPYPIIQKKVSYIKCQIIKKRKKCTVKTKAFSRVIDTVPIIYVVE